MKKLTALLNFAFLLLTWQNAQAQTPADSLTGVYAGEYWYASPPSNPWTKLADTITVYIADSTNCKIQFSADPYFSTGGTLSYYSTYYSCNTLPPNNYFRQFYSNDSLKMIDDNVAQPPPNPTISSRFYGKRIAPYITGIIHYAIQHTKYAVYPNPASSVVQVSGIRYQIASIKLTDVLGNELLQTDQTSIDVNNIPNGLYFLKINNVYTKKIIIQH